MDTARSRVGQVRANTTAYRRERNGSTITKRSSAVCGPREKGDEKRIVMSPMYFSRPFTRGRFFRSRFYYRGRDDGFARRASYGLRLHRYPRSPALQAAARSCSPSLRLARPAIQRSSAPPSELSAKKLEKSTPTIVRQLKKSASPADHSLSSSLGSVERPLLSFTVTPEEQFCSSKETPSSVTRAAARNRAIQKKREEIEDVYRRDCDTFGVVVKMLVAKDPSLEKTIQSSLRENLREIGLRCVEAMEQFIQEYDSRDPGTRSISQLQ